jgi:uncharacterized protein YjiK
VTTEDAGAAQKAKEERKAEKLERDGERPLDGWERYRAIADALEEGHLLIELADRKARFALVIMGALNVFAFFVITRMDVMEVLPASARRWAGAYLVLYGLVAVYFFLQAIETLRPRRIQPRLEYPGVAGPLHYPLGLRHYQDILKRDVEAHRRAWREVRIGQLNAELAVQTHALALVNQQKYVALHRLFFGLRVLTLMAATSIVAVALFSMSAGKAALPRPLRALRLLGEPERLPETAAREPSGIAYVPAMGRLFVAGDKGWLVELDASGALVRETPLRGNLEDVAFHPPSGHLVLLSEKKSELVVFDPAAGRELRRIPLDGAELLGRAPGDKNHGFEGLAYREDPGSADRGTFYLVHQRSPSMVVSVSFDPEAPPARLGRDAVQARFDLPGHRDLTAATWVPSLDRLLVLTDARDEVLVLRDDGEVEAALAVAGAKQEGLAFDASGDLWVTDDRSGLLRFRGALGALRGALAAGAGG